MSETEYKKLRTHLRLLTITVVVFILLAVASLVHTFVNPKTTSFPQVQVINGKDGKDAQIDYPAIYQYIQTQIAQIPKPQNGTNGTDGQSITGSPGASVQGPQGAPGVGSQGDPGTAGKEIELQYNPIKQETEWRYVGDFGWEVLVQNCQILGTC